MVKHESTAFPAAQACRALLFTLSACVIACSGTSFGASSGAQGAATDAADRDPSAEQGSAGDKGDAADDSMAHASGKPDAKAADAAAVGTAADASVCSSGCPSLWGAEPTNASVTEASVLIWDQKLWQ